MQWSFGSNQSEAAVLGSIPSFSDTVKSEGRQMKQCWIKYIKNKFPFRITAVTVIGTEVPPSGKASKKRLRLTQKSRSNQFTRYAFQTKDNSWGLREYQFLKLTQYLLYVQYSDNGFRCSYLLQNLQILNYAAKKKLPFGLVSKSQSTF